MEIIGVTLLIVAYGYVCFFLGQWQQRQELLEDGVIEYFVDENGEVWIRAKTSTTTDGK
jgi:hypothetical protein